MEAILKELGHVPVWYRNLRPGHRFPVLSSLLGFAQHMDVLVTHEELR